MMSALFLNASCYRLERDWLPHLQVMIVDAWGGEELPHSPRWVFKSAPWTIAASSLWKWYTSFEFIRLDSYIICRPSPNRLSSQLSPSSSNFHPSEASPPPQTQIKFKILQRRPQDGRDSKTQQKPKPTKDEKKQNLDREKEYEKVRKAIFSGMTKAF